MPIIGVKADLAQAILRVIDLLKRDYGDRPGNDIAYSIRAHGNVIAQCGMSHGPEVVKPLIDEDLSKKIACYDDGGKSADRYTVVYLEQLERDIPGPRPHKPRYSAVGMSANPFHPQGVGQHCIAQRGRHLGKKIKFSDLPEDCQKLVLRDLYD